MSELEELRKVIFNMLNFTNMYCLVLDQDMIIKFVNMSLAIDLGYKSYEELIGVCWLDFIEEKDRKAIKVIHKSVADDLGNWRDKYREVENNIINRDGVLIPVYWFNSHINTELNWTFSFGIKKREVTTEEDNIRDFYYDLVRKDRVMINSMRDSMGLRDKIVDTCRPSFIDKLQ